jgi:membrane protease YdiL (CAAX protease family)
MLPMMLLLTGMLGAFFPALNATTMERELGTLEALLVTPATKMELLIAKGALVLISGLLTAGVNLLSMSLVLWRSFSLAVRTPETLTLNPGALALTYLAAVPTLIFFAAAVMVVGLFARNYREANAYATPVMLLSMVPMLVSITDPKATTGLLLTPTVNTTLIIRDVLGGQATPSAFLLAFLSSSLYAGLMLSLAARLFSTEHLVNPAWEPLSLKGLRHSTRRRERRLPAVDEALALFALSLLLVLYVSPVWQKWGLLTMVAGNQLLLIAAPALLFAWLGRYRWVETFAWRRPSAGEMAGAALIGVGLVPWINALLALQNQFWPLDPELTRSMAEQFLPALQRRPVLTVVAIGLLAGVCEELLFRGPIQTALTRRLPAWCALGFGGLLFGAAHMYVQGLPLLTLIGVLLGWIVLRGGSIFPAMLLHAVYDMTKLGLSAWAIRAWGPEQMLQLSASPDTAILGPWSEDWTVFALALGAAFLLAGWSLCTNAHRRRAQLGQQLVSPA